MAQEADIPIPVRFNPFKHHRNYILRILEGISSDVIISLLDPVCNNYNDIYTGNMAPGEIGSAVIEILKSNQVFQPDDFSRGLAAKNGYQQIKLEDQSEWVVRRSIDNERYIHIHPARNSPFTIRFKGSTLKTVYLLKVSFTGFQETLSLESVNRTRMQIGLSPVRKLDRNKGILKCYISLFELFDLTGISPLREKPLRNPTFICDVHLGRLCKYLRMLGWDTLYSNRYTPEEIIAISRYKSFEDVDCYRRDSVFGFGATPQLALLKFKSHLIEPVFVFPPVGINIDEACVSVDEASD